ncbi:hypothetical protein [Pseudomonas entomophila]|uniref:Uncharacterized protein n=2 Tax=Pseudomonas entomophila TaxID=312306 RepID=Q1I3W3_PSEE4|nr:hypothetical protein [Pseudomonas entomophila]WMW06625.1 hypothetical protein RAH46_04620 [Pseudomonas entomophila]CAK17673.1 conserved hypothetical protein [Pseudomonas entomophila L48]
MQPSPTATPQLVYLAFGASTYHQEACFSIVSAPSHPRPSETMGNLVYTDDPAPYGKLPVTLRLLQQQKA